MTRYAEHTSVSVEKSRAEIETILTRYGAREFGYMVGGMPQWRPKSPMHLVGSHPRGAGGPQPMSAAIPKLLTVALGLTVLAAAYNATRPETRWPCAAPYNHPPGEYRDCGPGPRVLVVGGSVALGQGASATDREWWVLACRRLGGYWLNVAVPGARARDEVRQLEEHPGYDVVIALDGANDLVYGLAPGIRRQVDKRLPGYIAAVQRMRELRPDLLHVLQPAPFGMPSANTAGHEAELRAIYARMGEIVDLDLSGARVDYVDMVHFGDAGQRVVADAIAGRLDHAD